MGQPYDISVPWARAGWSVVMAALLLGCASSQTTAGGLYQVPVAAPQGPVERAEHPCWLSGPCRPYTAGAYLLGVGGGLSVASAEASARAAIAKIFEVRVREERESVDSLYHASTGAGVTGPRSVVCALMIIMGIQFMLFAMLYDLQESE